MMIEIDYEQGEEEDRSYILKPCSKACIDKEVSCDFSQCPFWINFEEDHNCDLVSINKHGSLTLREVGERLGISYVRVKQIEDIAIKKIKNNTLLIIND